MIDKPLVLKKITLEQVLSWDPWSTYNHERLQELFAGRELLDALEILDVDIPVSDRFWVVFRKEVLPAEILHEIACRYAEQAFCIIYKIGLAPDSRSAAAIEAKRKWLKGEITDEELAAAADAAWAAAWDAAWAAAWDAAGAAARGAAWAAARSAAWAAARSAADAAWDAAWAAAWDAAGAEQIKLLKDLILEFMEKK